MTRPDRDQIGLLLAQVWALRGTCARRRVGCVLTDAAGFVLGSGYNGPASWQAHCTDHPCPGAELPSGIGLDLCEAVHAEQNALLRCERVRDLYTCYSTVAPCLHCVKLLLNTPCRRVVFLDDYSHAVASHKLWTREQVGWQDGWIEHGAEGQSYATRVPVYREWTRYSATGTTGLATPTSRA